MPTRAAQEHLRLDGHAIEARLCAEDPADNFAPQTGHVDEIFGSDLRGDSIEADGNPASGHYDSLLMKLIAGGETREKARQKLIEGLDKVHVVGIRTNRNFLIDVLRREAVAQGEVDIRWLEREPAYVENNVSTVLGEIAALWLARTPDNNGWRSTGNSRAIVILRERTNTGRFVIEGGRLGAASHVEVVSGRDESWRLRLFNNAKIEDAWVYHKDNRIHVHHNGRDALFEDITYAPAEPKGAAANVIRAPMAGRIVKVLAEPGQKVAKNQILVILEAMKMEHELKAAADAVIDEVAVKPGDQVAIRQTMVTLKQ